MSEFNWCGYNWLTSERWGQVHPEKTNWWYDEDSVSVDDSNNLILSIFLKSYSYKYSNI